MMSKNAIGLISVDDVSFAEGSSLPSRMIVLLICFIPVFMTLLFGGVDNITWVFVSLFWLLLVGSWAADAWTSGGILFSGSWLQLPLAGFLLIGLVQLLPLGGDVGGLNVPASATLSLDPHSTRFFVVKLIVYLTYFAACLAFINSEKRLRKVVWLIVIFSSLMAFYGILQRLATPEGIYGVRTSAGSIPFGPFVNQHHFATFMQMAAGLTLSLLFAVGASKERRMLLAAALVVMGVATVSTSSRGGLLGFLGVVAFVLLLNLFAGRWSKKESSGFGSQRLFAIGAATLALLIAVVGVALLIGGNDSLLRGVGAVKADGDISSGRLHFWPIAWKIFLEHPILGSGLESFGVAFTRHDIWSGQFRVEQAHNEYLQTLADAGIAGAICLIAFIVLLFKRSLATIAGSEGFRRDAAVGALAGCFGVLLHSFFDFPLRTPSNAFFFLLLAAVATVSIKSEASSRRRRHRSTGP
jgi:O-antigen ligase